MLEVRNITKVYKSGRNSFRALNDVNINFGSRGLVVILGKSGCGKSTLLNIIGGLDEPTRGEVIIDGQSTKNFKKSDFDAYRNTFVGIVFQEFNLIDEISVFENINMTMKLQEQNADVNTVDEVLAMVGLNNLGYRKPTELSGGQRQRVALARALLKKPEIILADEPTGALDSVTSEEVFESLKKIALTKLVIVVTHNRDLAHTYGDRILELVDGEIVGDKTKESSESGYVKELSDSVIEVSTGGKLTAGQLKRRLKKGKVNYIGISHDKDRIALAYPETVDSFYASADAAAYTPTQPEQISTDDKKFKLGKGKLRMKDALKLARGNIKRSKKRHRLLITLSVICFTFLSVALVVGTISPPAVAAKSAFDVGSQPLVAVGKSFNSYSLNKMSDIDIKKVVETMDGRAAKGVVISATPAFASKNEEFNNYYDDHYMMTSYEDSSFQLDKFNGVLEIDDISSIGLKTVAGVSKPSTLTEIIISDFAAWELMRSGFVGYDADGKFGINYLQNENQLIGCRIMLNQTGQLYRIVGIFDTDYEDFLYTRTANAMDDKVKDDVDRFKVAKGFLYKKIIAAEGFGKTFKSNVSDSNRNNSLEFRAEIKMGDTVSYLFESARMPYMSYDKKYFQTDMRLLWSENKEGNKYIPPETLAADEMIAPFSLLQMVLQDYDYQNPEDILNNPRFNQAVADSYDFKVFKASSELASLSDMKIVGVLSPYGESSPMINPDVANSLVEVSDGYDMLFFHRGASQSVLSSKFNSLDKRDAGYIYGSASADLLLLSDFGEIIDVMAKVFFYVAVGAMVLAFLIIFNYMTASIKFRTKEIAVYRVIGAKSFDIAKIFLAEDGLIVLKTSVISIILSFLLTLILNASLGAAMGMFGITFTLIYFNWLIEPLAIILGSAVMVLISSMLPILSVTRKRPVEAVKMI